MGYLNIKAVPLDTARGCFKKPNMMLTTVDFEVGQGLQANLCHFLAV